MGATSDAATGNVLDWLDAFCMTAGNVVQADDPVRFTTVAAPFAKPMRLTGFLVRLAVDKGTRVYFDVDVNAAVALFDLPYMASCDSEGMVASGLVAGNLVILDVRFRPTDFADEGEEARRLVGIIYEEVLDRFGPSDDDN